MSSGQNKFPLETEESLTAYYGHVGLHQRELILPYTHYYWENNKPIQAFLCHSLVHDSLKRIFENVLMYYGAEEIRKLRLDIWGGCLYLRSVRGDQRFSTHSWGIAIDYDPINNQIGWKKDKALLARPEYDIWWKCWEDEGWFSLGRKCDYDWMHIQAAIR